MANDSLLQNALNVLLGIPSLAPSPTTAPSLTKGERAGTTSPSSSLSSSSHRAFTLSSPRQCTVPVLPNIGSNSSLPRSPLSARKEGRVSNDSGESQRKDVKHGFVFQRRAQIAALREEDNAGATNASDGMIQTAKEIVQKYLIDKGELEEFAARTANLLQDARFVTSVSFATEGHGDCLASFCIAVKRELFEGKFHRDDLLDLQHKWLLDKILEQHSSVELAALQPEARTQIYIDSLHRALSDDSHVFHCICCKQPLVSFTQNDDVGMSAPSRDSGQVSPCCGHSCCRSCLVSRLETAITEQSGPVSCPAESCTRTLQDEEVQDLVSEEVFENCIQAFSPSSSSIGWTQSSHMFSPLMTPRKTNRYDGEHKNAFAAKDRVASYDAERKKTLAQQNTQLRKLLKKNKRNRRPTTPEKALINAQRRAAYDAHRKTTAGELQAELVRQSEASEFKVVSLGCCCHVNLALLNMSLRQEAYPFDNIRMSMKGLLHFLANQFMDFIPYESTDGRQTRQTYEGEYHSFWHDNLDSANDHAKYKRRTDRFLALGSLEKPLLFVFVCNSSAEVSDGECLLESLRLLFEASRVWVLLIVDGQQAAQFMEVEGTGGRLLMYCMLWHNCEDQGSLFMEGVKEGVSSLIKHVQIADTTHTTQHVIQSCSTLEPRLIPYAGGDTRRQKYRLRKFDHRRARSIIRPSKANPSCSDVDAQA